MVRWTMIALAAMAAVGVAATLWDAAPARAAEPVAEATEATGSSSPCPCNKGAATSLYGSPYPCIREVPPWVGYTYITYGPLDPSEFSHPHHHRYVQSNCSGKTVTRVHYRR